MAKPVFHPALADIPEEVEAMRARAVALGVPLEEFAACFINALASMLVRRGSTSDAIFTALGEAYASHTSH